MSLLGARLHLDFPRVELATVNRARNIPSAVIGDVCHRLFSLQGGFQNYAPTTPTFAGPALTVRVRPGDNLFLHKALDVALPGDVVVVNAGGALDNAIIGAMMGNYAARRGVAAVIIDGAVRDLRELQSLPIPIWARGATPNGPWKTGPGEIGYPVAVGGLSVSSGDLVVGDADGVIVLPREDAAEVLTLAENNEKTEARWADEIARDSWPRGWVDEAIAKL